MALLMETFQINFDPSKGEEQNEPETVIFDQDINPQNVEVTVSGFEAKYSDKDHELLELKVDTSITEKTTRSVKVMGSFLLRDSSGNIDDRYEGFIKGVVFAEMAETPEEVLTVTALRQFPQAWLSLALKAKA